jgi:hypothetical protein
MSRRLVPYRLALANQSLEQDQTKALNELDKMKAAAREVADGINKSRSRLKQLEVGLSTS